MSKENEIPNEVIGAAIEVHRNLGPGLLESAYEECLCYEFDQRGIRYERQKPLPIAYKETKLDCGYRLDMVVNDLVILELKAVDQIQPIHSAQVLTYLKLSSLRLGILINFNVTVLKNGIKRIVNEL